MYLFKHHDNYMYFFVSDAFSAPFNLTIKPPILWWYMLILRWHLYMIYGHSNMQLMQVVRGVVNKFPDWIFHARTECN